MKLIDIAFDNEGVMHIVRPKGIMNYFLYITHPKIILTKEEAKLWKINPNNKKGYYTEVDDISVPVDIED